MYAVVQSRYLAAVGFASHLGVSPLSCLFKSCSCLSVLNRDLPSLDQLRNERVSNARQPRARGTKVQVNQGQVRGHLATHR